MKTFLKLVLLEILKFVASYIGAERKILISGEKIFFKVICHLTLIVSCIELKPLIDEEDFLKEKLPLLNIETNLTLPKQNLL